MYKSILLFVLTSILTVFVVSCGGNGGGTTGGGDTTPTLPPTTNSAPVASVGNDCTVAVGEIVELDGSDSFDADEDTLRYTWFVRKPGESVADIVNATSSIVAFVPDVEGRYTVELVVNDGKINSLSATMFVFARKTITTNVANVSEFRAALFAAENNNVDDIIVLSDGIYKTTYDGLGTFMYVSSDDRYLTLKGSDPTRVILSGDGVDKVLSIDGGSYINYDSLRQQISLYNLSIVDGFTNGYGAGFNFQGGKLIADNCIISNNHTTGKYGGGILLTSGPVSLNNVKIKNNSALNGGGIATFDSVEIKIENSSINNNISTYGSGGGIYSEDLLNISNSIISGNEAQSQGGGIFSEYGVGKHIISDSVIRNNTITPVTQGVPAGKGGGIYSPNSHFYINKTIFSNNTARDGSGLNISNTHITNSIFERNNSVNSSILISGYNNSSLVNSLVINNSNGLVIGGGTKTNILNSVFINNGNFDIDGGDSTRANVDNNFINESNINIVAYLTNNVFSSNPSEIGFQDEANSDYHLIGSSLMINAGISNHAEVDIPVTDMDGVARPQGASIDIGPYEYY